MISRFSERVPFVVTLVAAAALASACQKVPLLAPSGSSITLTSTATALPVNGTAQIIAQLVEPAGTPPHSGTQVAFTTTLGSIEPAAVETDINGRATVTFRSGTVNGTATISATSGGVTASGNNALKIAVGTAGVGRIVLSASPTLVPAIGGMSTLTAVVQDINGNALPSAPVSFSTTAGSLDTAVATTDQSGVATARLTTATTATVTASVGAQGGSTSGGGGGTTTTPTTPSTGTSSGQASATVTINIAAAPTLVITAPTTPPSSGLPSQFTFAVTVPTANGSTVRNLTVNWGDGEVQNLGAVTGSAVVAHTYRSPGSYVITGTVTDSSGNVVTVSTGVIVNPAALTLTITPPTAPPSANLPASFTIVVGTLPPGDAVRNVHLDWGDGTSQDLGAVSGSTTVSHIFRASGTYTISATLSDTAGNTISNSTTVTVIPVPKPTIIITPSPVPGKVNTQTNLQIQVTLPTGISVQDLSIDFGDGQRANLGGATSANVPHVYTATGTFTVTVTVLDTSGQTTIGTTAVSIGP
jgi:Big-like domain-containing protein/PKD domain-containing protein